MDTALETPPVQQFAASTRAPSRTGVRERRVSGRMQGSDQRRIRSELKDLRRTAAPADLCQGQHDKGELSCLIQSELQ